MNSIEKILTIKKILSFEMNCDYPPPSQSFLGRDEEWWMCLAQQNGMEVMVIFNLPRRNESPPPRNKGLIRPYQEKPMVNKPAKNKAGHFWRGYVRGGRLKNAIKKASRAQKIGPRLIKMKHAGWIHGVCFDEHEEATSKTQRKGPSYPRLVGNGSLNAYDKAYTRPPSIGFPKRNS